MSTIFRRQPEMATYGALMRVKLWVPEQLNAELTAANNVVSPPIETIAEVDTGATMTGITPAMVSQLGLVQAGSTNILTSTGQRCKCKQYWVRILFSQGTAIEVLATEAAFNVDGYRTVECILGRDILEQTTLIYHGKTNEFSLTF